MSPQFLEIEERALELPEKDRESLVESLLDSLQSDAIRRSWVATAERRYRDLVDGRVESIPMSEALADLEKEFGWAT